MEPLYAVELAVPDFAGSDHPFNDATLAVQMLHAHGRVEQLLAGLEAPDEVRVRVFAGAAFGLHQVQRLPLTEIAALSGLAVRRLE